MKWYALLLFFAVFFAGCSGNQGDDIDLSGSERGLSFSFLENSPPTEIAQDLPFTAVLEVENKGGYAIETFGGRTLADKESCEEIRETFPKERSFRINATLSGIFYRDFNLSHKNALTVFPEAGNSDAFRESRVVEGTSISGERAFLSFPSVPSNDNFLENKGREEDVDATNAFEYKGSVENRLPVTLRANVCYQYGVTATGLFCTLADARVDDPFCDPQGSIALDSTRGHVDVALEESVVGQNQFRLTFTFTERAGSGVLLKPWSGDKCTNELLGTFSEPVYSDINNPTSPSDALGFSWNCALPSTEDLRERNRVFVDIDIGETYRGEDASDDGTIEEKPASRFTCRGFIESVEEVIKFTREEREKLSVKERNELNSNGELKVPSLTAGHISLERPAKVVCTFVAEGTDKIDASRPVTVNVLYHYFDTLSQDITVVEVLQPEGAEADDGAESDNTPASPAADVKTVGEGE